MSRFFWFANVLFRLSCNSSKDKLDVYVPAAKEGARPATTEVDNRIEGFRTIRDLARKAGAIVCLEPTLEDTEPEGSDLIATVNYHSRHLIS